MGVVYGRGLQGSTSDYGSGCLWSVLIADEHLSALRKYCGMAESSSINALASLVVLYLMTHIMREQLR